MSAQLRPASARADLAASAPMLSAVLPGNRPNGCRPTPTMATSGTLYLLRAGRTGGIVRAGDGVRPGGGVRGEREGDDLVAGFRCAERHHYQPHRHADAQCVLRAADEDALHPQLPGELDQPYVPGLERFSGEEGAGKWRLRREAL